MATAMTDQERLLGYAATADIGELTGVIRTLTIIRDSRVAAKAEGKASKSSTKVAKAASAPAASTSETTVSAEAKAKAAAEGKDPERVERGLKAAATRARKKAEKEAAAQGHQEVEEQAPVAQPAVSQAPSVPQSVVDEDQEDLSNFRVPHPRFGPEGELLPQEQ